jgi:hypothetical protein
MEGNSHVEVISSKHNINKSHIRITSCYFLAEEISHNPSFREIKDNGTE